MPLKRPERKVLIVPKVDNNGLNKSVLRGGEQDGLRRYRLVLGGSIVVYLALAVLIARYLPDYSILAWIFVIFSIHSAFVLFTGRRRQEP